MMLKSFLSLFLQDKCPLCDRPAVEVVCRDCDRQLHQTQFPNPQRYWRNELPLFVWGNYDGITKRAIAAMKYDNQPQLGPWFGRQLAQQWRKTLPQNPQVTVMPIPLHPQKQQQRGFNQAELISRQFAQLMGLPHDARSLQRTKATQALFELNVQQRQRELQQAFYVTPQSIPKLRQRPILLIDDIYTTGTTALEAQQTLQSVGLTVYGIAAIATPKSPKTIKR